MEAADKRPGQADVEFQRQLYTDPNPTRRGLHRQRRDWVLAQVTTHSGPGDRVLEVGVGCGVFTEALAGSGRLVTAVDINAAFLDNVADIPGVKTHLQDATHPLGLGEHQFAICSEVLEHVPRDRSVAMLKALHDALAPDGILIMTTPQRYSSVELMARLFRFKPILALARKIYGHAEELGHINLLTFDQLVRQLHEVGFVVESNRRFGFYLPIIAEFGGRAGAAALEKIEWIIRRLPVARALLWTQGWVLRRSA